MTSLVVEALHDPTGKQLLSTEILEDQLPMLAERAGDLLHGLDAGTHSLAARLVEKVGCPSRRAVLPELLEGLLEKVNPDGLQAIPKQVAQAEALLGLRFSSRLSRS